VTGPDRDRFSRADESVRAATPLEWELAALEPAAPAPGLRERIAAELSASTTPTRGSPIRGVLERLAWAVGGALAATVVLGLPAGDAKRREASERIVTAEPAASVVADRSAEPAAAWAGPGLPLAPLLSEETSRWADEGVTFLDDTTPARVLRRMVVERHRAPNGQAQVRVPRADVILLPVAFQ
jgi:hypothetical protein